MNQPVLLHQRRDLTELINATFWYFRQHYSPLLLTLACGIVPLKLLQSVAVKVYAKQAATANYNWLRTHGTASFTEWTLFTNTLSPSFFVVLFFGAFTALFIALVVNSHLIEHEETPDEPITQKRIWERIETDLFTSTGLWFLLTFLLFVSLSFFLIPGIYLLVPFSIALFVHMREGTSIFQTLRRSYDLCRGHWWRGFGLVALLLLMQLALAFSFGLAFNFLWRVAGLGPDNWIRGPLQIMVSVVESVAAAITYIALAFQYYNLLEEKEGIGLLTFVETIGEAAPRRHVSINGEPPFNSLD